MRSKGMALELNALKVGSNGGARFFPPLWLGQRHGEVFSELKGTVLLQPESSRCVS